MIHVLYYGSAILAALALGAASAWWAVGCGMRGGVACGAWRHFPDYGSSSANPWVRAQTQLAGPMALRRTEAIYFIADCDDRGEPLQPERTYRIEGGPLPGRWWSVTVYGTDHRLIANAQDRYSFNSENAVRNPDGSWTVRLAGAEQPGNWIPTGAGRRFEVFLRLYNPPPAALDDLGLVVPPRIVCEEPGHE